LAIRFVVVSLPAISSGFRETAHGIVSAPPAPAADEITEVVIDVGRRAGAADHRLRPSFELRHPAFVDAEQMGDDPQREFGRDLSHEVAAAGTDESVEQRARRSADRLLECPDARRIEGPRRDPAHLGVRGRVLSEQGAVRAGHDGRREVSRRSEHVLDVRMPCHRVPSQAFVEHDRTLVAQVPADRIRIPPDVS
jgi:hypothetical protein